jgi:hypothetical protein
MFYMPIVFDLIPQEVLKNIVLYAIKSNPLGLSCELRDPCWRTRLHFYLFPVLVLALVPLQTFLDFNAVYILFE